MRIMGISFVFLLVLLASVAYSLDSESLYYDYDDGYVYDPGSYESGYEGAFPVDRYPTYALPKVNACPMTYTMMDCCTEGILGGADSVCFETRHVQDCLGVGGAIQNCIPVSLSSEPQPGMPQQLDATWKASEIDFRVQLTQVAMGSGIADPSRYDTDMGRGRVYQCDDYAGDMEQYLQNKGYDATVTIITKWKWKFVYGIIPKRVAYFSHALVDVHTPGGTTLFIEPQNGEFVTDLDQNGDGKVGAYVHEDYKPGVHFTEGDASIYIYDSALQAETHGANVDYTPWPRK